MIPSHVSVLMIARFHHKLYENIYLLRRHLTIEKCLPWKCIISNCCVCVCAWNIPFDKKRVNNNRLRWQNDESLPRQWQWRQHVILSLCILHPTTCYSQVAVVDVDVWLRVDDAIYVRWLYADSAFHLLAAYPSRSLVLWLLVFFFLSLSLSNARRFFTLPFVRKKITNRLV